MHIVVPDGYTLNPGDNPWDALRQLGTVTVYDRTPDAEIVVRCRDAEVLVINKVRLTAARLRELPKLEFVSVTATGFDCIDAQAARALSVPVSNVPVYGTDSVAQFVFAMLLELCHHVSRHDQAVRQGEWAARGDFSFWLSPQVELAGKTMGVVGFGRIGSRVSELAVAFGMRVLAHTRSPDAAGNPPGVTFVSLEQLVAEADVISLHCPLTDATRNLVDASLLAKCKPSTFLINASRGALVVEDDLAAALRERRIAGAAVDVVSREPIEASNPLSTAPNCLITPHMAWASLAARRRLMQTTVENVAAFQRGEPQNLVN